MTFRPLIGTFMICGAGLGLVACGDAAGTDDASSSGPGSSSGGDLTEVTPTGDVPTTGDASSDATGDDSTTGDPAPVACNALPLPDALVDGGAWDPTLTIAGFAGADGLNPGVHDFARDAEGHTLAVGYFQYLGVDRVPPFVRLAGDVWQAEPTLTIDLERPTISAVAADELGNVAIATYSALPGDLAQRTGELLIREDGEFTLVGTFKGAVRRMAWYDGELWVGGVYDLDGESVGPGLAVHGSMGWQDPPGGPLVGDGVYEVTVEGDELLIGGAFSGVGGIAAQSVASWDGAEWTGFDLPEANVYALARDEQDQLYAGGLFSVEGSFTAGGVARWSGDGWVSMAGGLANSSFRGVVSDLVIHDGALTVAGCFASAGGAPDDPAAVPAQDLARWRDGAWEPLAEPGAGVGSVWFSPLKCGDEGPAAAWEMQYQRLFVDDERLLVGGFFPGVAGTPSQSVLAREGDAWVPQGVAGRGFSGAPRSLAVGGPDCAAHVMGGTTHAGALAVDGRVLRDDGDAWTPVGPPVPADMYCWQLAVDGAGAPVLACDGPQVGDDPPAGQVLRLVDDAWQQVGDGFAQGGAGAVGFDPAGTLWAAGGGAEGYVARLVDEVFVVSGGFNGRVSALAFRPTGAGQPVQVVAGGYFTELDGAPAGGVARWTGDAWETLGQGLSGSVLAVAYADDGSIYASTADDGTPDRKILARWDGDTWSDVATPEPGPVPAGYAFYSLIARGKYVVAAGFAWPGSGQRNVFVYDGESFTSLRGGVTAISVDAAVLAGDGLWFAGTVAEAGPPDARISSVGVAHLE
ncbi:MAG TPA: hypothetical protein VGB85_21880 [Nannocystis sp.]